MYVKLVHKGIYVRKFIIKRVILYEALIMLETNNVFCFISFSHFEYPKIFINVLLKLKAFFFKLI